MCTCLHLHCDMPIGICITIVSCVLLHCATVLTCDWSRDYHVTPSSVWPSVGVAISVFWAWAVGMWSCSTCNRGCTEESLGDLEVSGNTVAESYPFLVLIVFAYIPFTHVATWTKMRICLHTFTLFLRLCILVCYNLCVLVLVCGGM